MAAAKEVREVLFNEIGWGDLIGNRAYWDTCAIRMSYGLSRGDWQACKAPVSAHP